MLRITASELSQKIQQGERPLIIDVRTPAEYAAVHLPASHNLPMGTFGPDAISALAKAGDQVFLMCRTQRRAEMVCQQLTGQLECELVVVDGGVEQVEPALLARQGREVMGLDRQVRIAAGSLVVLGVAGGFFVAPWLFGLSGFVGAGLVFSGLTDTCPMGSVISRMPWNQA
ncbi:rhodanese-like domain-containing protein [Simiduia agarivorans]|uniref:Rhodanese domain-containing protein n=1 Tax=Simiduia agarivorans (strain DSM 21679 / JCM 13881 / BCRC 17597 / SA1) TaxID=1117647 RepID=K4L3P0_SIMAS|nr:rhodanese-like domain-containing protein [Simiduia agarivorans]AFV00818.1 rhodanese domain-containing protein [Simiduia agarivorans SA1 = DSM 21679]